jgi:hypothetical protein
MEPGTSLANSDGMLVKIVIGREGVRGESEATRSTKEEVKREYSSLLRAETWRDKEGDG